jgi:hypothetical protein
MFHDCQSPSQDSNLEPLYKPRSNTFHTSLFGNLFIHKTYISYRLQHKTMHDQYVVICNVLKNSHFTELK